MTRAPLLLLISGFVVGCGAPLENMAKECSVDGLGPVTSDKPISCSNLSKNVSLAMDLLREHGQTVDASTVAVNIRDERCLSGPHIGEIPLPGCKYGEYYAATSYQGASIDLDWDGGELVHELLHHYETTHGRADLTQSHKDWHPLGYYDLSDEFAAARLPLN